MASILILAMVSDGHTGDNRLIYQGLFSHCTLNSLMVSSKQKPESILHIFSVFTE